MKVALDAFNLSPHLMTQPNAYRCPDCGPFGWLSLPEFPYGEEMNMLHIFPYGEDMNMLHIFPYGEEMNMLHICYVT